MSADMKGWILIYITYYADYCPLDNDEDNGLHVNSVNNNSSSQKFKWLGIYSKCPDIKASFKFIFPKLFHVLLQTFCEC